MNITDKLFDFLRNDRNVSLEKVKEYIENGASCEMRFSLSDTPINALWLSLRRLNINIIKYLYSICGINKEYSHIDSSFENYYGIEEISNHEILCQTTRVIYRHSYYTELRRLHSHIFNDYQFQYDLYVFYLYEAYRVKTALTLDDFRKSLKMPNTEYPDDVKREKYNKWKEIIELLGFTEEEILSKENENFLKDCEEYYDHPSEYGDDEVETYNAKQILKLLDKPDVTLDEIRVFVENGAGDYSYSQYTYEPINVVWKSLRTMNLDIIEYLYRQYGIDKEYSHVDTIDEDYINIDELEISHDDKGDIVGVTYNMNYYTELRRLRSLIFNNYQFEYDLYTFYLYMANNKKTALTLEGFSHLYKRVIDERFTEGRREENYKTWKKIVDILGLTEEEILSKKYEDFSRDCEYAYKSLLTAK